MVYFELKEDMCDRECRINLCEKPPPLPVAQFEVGCTVPLDDADGVDLLHTLVVVSGVNKGHQCQVFIF